MVLFAPSLYVSGGLIFILVKNYYYFYNLFSLAMLKILLSAKLAIDKGQAQGCNETYLKQLSDYIVPALVEALPKVVYCLSIMPSKSRRNVMNFLLICWFSFVLLNYESAICVQECDSEIRSNILEAINECKQVWIFLAD